MKKSSMDLTKGNIAVQICKFALPILAGQIFQNLYNSVDSLVVGNFVGTTALAAVASSADISQLLIGFFTGMSTGAGVLFSRYFGAKNYEKLHDSIHTALTFAMILGLAMAMIGIIGTPVLLHIVDCPDDVYVEAAQYLRIYLVGVFFTSLYNVGSGVLRAVGDSRSPFLFLVIASFVNMSLDILFVVVLQMGVIGVAFATIISQMISVLLVFRKMIFCNDVYQVNLKELHIDPVMLKEVIELGLPAGIQACLISISNLFVMRYINSFGSAAMAGIGAAKKVDRFVGMISQSIGLATATFVSQNVGARKYKRAYRGILICLVLCAIPVLILGSTVYIFAEDTIKLFIKDSEAIYYGAAMVHTMIPLYYCQSVNQVYSNAVRGFGKSTVVMLISMFGMIICRQIFLAIAMSISWDVRHVYRAFPVGWACSAVLVFIYFITKIRKHYPCEDLTES